MLELGAALAAVLAVAAVRARVAKRSQEQQRMYMAMKAAREAKKRMRNGPGRANGTARAEQIEQIPLDTDQARRYTH